jgi:hypothetical protein
MKLFDKYSQGEGNTKVTTTIVNVKGRRVWFRTEMNGRLEGLGVETEKRLNEWFDREGDETR